jgi:murein DD-endopeptidase MepM/ murein hydrolase activator NlpD
MSKNSERILKDTHYITSPFGMRYPFVNGKQRTDLKPTLHDGTDYGTNNKKVNCYAGYNGKVVNVSFNPGGGNCVIVEYNNGFRGHYRHLDKQLVSVGQTVSPDTIIGIVGTTGNSTGIHLHYSIQNAKTRVYEDYEKWAEPLTLKPIVEKPAAPVTKKPDVIYTVQKHDTLSAIASKYGTTYQKIASDNGIKNPNVINIGQKLIIK